MTRSAASGEIGRAAASQLRRNFSSWAPLVIGRAGCPYITSTRFGRAASVAKHDLHRDRNEGVRIRVAVHDHVHAAREREGIGVPHRVRAEVLRPDPAAEERAGGNVAAAEAPVVDVHVVGHHPADEVVHERRHPGDDLLDRAAAGPVETEAIAETRGRRRPPRGWRARTGRACGRPRSPARSHRAARAPPRGRAPLRTAGRSRRGPRAPRAAPRGRPPPCRRRRSRCVR